jgi:hypothetical protein
MRNSLPAGHPGARSTRRRPAPKAATGQVDPDALACKGDARQVDQPPADGGGQQGAQNRPVMCRPRLFVPSGPLTGAGVSMSWRALALALAR